MTGPAGISESEAFLGRVTEATIRIGVIALLVGWCFQITRPFIIPIVWGVIIATAIYPAYDWLQSKLGGRRRLAAALITLLGLALLFVPAALFTGSLASSAQWLISGLNSGTIEVPPPPDGVSAWPFIGPSLYEIWQLANVNLEAALHKAGPHLTGFIGGALSTAAGAGLGVLQFLISILISGVLLANSTAGDRVSRAIATKLAGERGLAFAALAGATVRSVSQGIIGVAFIQSALIAVGLFIFGVPHAALWSVLCLLFAVIQLPTFLVLIPIIIYVFTAYSTTASVLFTIWMVIAGGSDNILKPILLGRGLGLPMIVIFMGAIGGFITSGFIGLFVGAVVLALGYELFMAWLNEDTEAETTANPG
jgi:predicted PurR-regulated permease PerM